MVFALGVKAATATIQRAVKKTDFRPTCSGCKWGGPNGQIYALILFLAPFFENCSV